jgi:hypothetical protein
MSLLLSDIELRELTGYKRPTEQAQELAALGLPFRRRRDGTIIVFREDLRATAQDRPASPTLRLPPPRRLLAGQEG